MAPLLAVALLPPPAAAATRSRCRPPHFGGVSSRTALPCRRLPAHCRAGGGSGGNEADDLDVAVFRFTLGIPGFEDRYIPRVVGIGVAALLAANHLATEDPTTGQTISELVGGVLSVCAIAAPYVSQRLQDAARGGRSSVSNPLPRASNIFRFSEGLPDSAKQELAWATFALLKNCECRGAYLWRSRDVWCLRGEFALNVKQAGTEDFILQCLGNTATQWLPDGSAVDAAGVLQASLLPDSTSSVFITAIERGEGFLMMFSERPRALSSRDRAWVESIARKLSSSIPTPARQTK
eukprot:jgi/Chlat1/501/Chrsp103S01103